MPDTRPVLPTLRRLAGGVLPLLVATLLGSASLSPLVAQDVDALIEEVDAAVQDRAKLVQVMIDKIFSFSELGHREF